MRARRRYREARKEALALAGTKLALRVVLGAVDTLEDTYGDDFTLEGAANCLEDIAEAALRLKGVLEEPVACSKCHAALNSEEPDSEESARFYDIDTDAPLCMDCYAAQMRREYGHHRTDYADYAELADNEMDDKGPRGR